MVKADIFCAYGKAAMSAAGFENKLILLIALVRSQGKDNQFFSNEYKKIEKKTLGGLIREAEISSVFSDESKKNLSLILKYRNWMVHNIAQDVLGYVIQEDGELILERNLLELDKFFSNASEFLHVKIIELMEMRGIKAEVVNAIVKKVFDENAEPNIAIHQTAAVPSASSS